MSILYHWHGSNTNGGKAIPLDLLAFNRYHPLFKDLIKMSHREWIYQTQSDDLWLDRLAFLEMEVAEEYADRRLARLYQDRQLVEELIELCDEEDDRDVFRAWLADLYHHEMAIRGAVPGGIEC